MFRIGPVHALNNSQGVSDIEPERSARYRAYCTPEQE